MCCMKHKSKGSAVRVKADRVGAQTICSWPQLGPGAYSLDAWPGEAAQALLPLAMAPVVGARGGTAR